MAKILREETLRVESNDHYICTVILDVDDTKEGYCVEFYSEDESQSTSFGTSDLGYRMANLLYEALVHCCHTTLSEAFERIDGTSDRWVEEIFNHAITSEFWCLMHDRFDSGWVLCDSNSGKFNATDSEFLKLFEFIQAWSISC